LQMPLLGSCGGTWGSSPATGARLLRLRLIFGPLKEVRCERRTKTRAAGAKSGPVFGVVK
jgi:hypothetical protein